MNIIAKELIRKLKKIIESKGISQSDIAKKLNYTRSNISQFLNKESITLNTFCDLLNSVSISPFDLFDVDTSHNVVAPELDAEAEALSQIKGEPIEKLITALAENEKLRRENEQLKSSLNSDDKDRLDKFENQLIELTKQIRQQAADSAAREKAQQEENAKLRAIITGMANNEFTKFQIKKIILALRNQE